jgi:hypothetical protein
MSTVWHVGSCCAIGAAEIRVNAFEPFFTAKGPGKGTGLGLSMVDGLARRAGGGVTIDSIVDEGTTISIHLPQAGVLPDKAEVLLPALPVTLQRLRVLLVDDDPIVIESTKAMIEDLGHVATEAPDGTTAMDILPKAHDFDVLVVDFAMPMMTAPNLLLGCTCSFPACRSCS